MYKLFPFKHAYTTGAELSTTWYESRHHEPLAFNKSSTDRGGIKFKQEFISIISITDFPYFIWVSQDTLTIDDCGNLIKCKRVVFDCK